MDLLLPSEILSKAKTIAEGQEVTYHLKGGVVRVYRKINGKLKFVRQYKSATSGGKVEKTTVPQKATGVQLSKEYKALLEETGVKCLDEEAYKYVKDQVSDYFKKADVEINYEKMPKYIRSLTFPTSNVIKYTPNKIYLNINRIFHQVKDQPTFFDGLSDKVMDTLKKIKDMSEEKTEEQKLAGRLHDDYFAAYNKKKEAAIEVNRAMLDNSAVKDMSYVTSHEFFWQLDSRRDSKEELKEIMTEQFDSTKKGYDKIEAAIKDYIDRSKQQDEAGRKHRVYVSNSSKYAESVKRKRRKAKSAVTVMLNSLSKDDADKFRDVYIALRTNDELRKKRAPLITAKDAEFIKDTNTLRQHFIRQYAPTLKTKAAKERLLSIFSESGDEKKTVALKSVTIQEKQKIYDKMVQSFDKATHKEFGFKIHGAFKIDETEYYEKYKKLEKKLGGDIVFSYHGTSFESACKISKGGFKITNPKTGRMLGDGVYGSVTSSKSLQYLSSEGFSRGVGERGVLLVCKTVLGEVYQMENNPSLIGNRQLCNQLKSFNTLYAKKGLGSINLKNDEFVCKQAEQLLPIYWVDVELTQPGTFEKSIKLVIGGSK